MGRGTRQRKVEAEVFKDGSNRGRGRKEEERIGGRGSG